MNGPSIRDLKAIVESYNQEVEEANRMPNGDPVPDSLEVSIDDILPRRDNNDFEPKTNMCPDCEGTGQNRMKNDSAFPGLGYDCERCDGEGAVFEDNSDSYNAPYEDTDKWQGQAVRITGGKAAGNVGTVTKADWYRDENGGKQAKFTIKLDDGNAVVLFPGEWADDQLELDRDEAEDNFMYANPFESINEAATRKDFRMVADLISKIEDPALRKSSAEDHAKMFALQNPRFNRTLFMAACGVEEGLGEGDKPYATMKDGPDKYLFRKDQKQKLVGSADNEPDDGEEELEETDMDKFIKEMQVAAGITPLEDRLVEGLRSRMADALSGFAGEGVIQDVIKKESQNVINQLNAMIPDEHPKAEAIRAALAQAHEYLLGSTGMQDFEERGQEIGPKFLAPIMQDTGVEEDCDQDVERNDDGDCSPFTHADDNVEMVREEPMAVGEPSGLAKLARVISSINSPKQLAAAEKYAEMMWDEMRGGGISEFGKDMDLLRDIHRDMKDKARELGVGSTKFHRLMDDIGAAVGEDLLLAPKDAQGPEVDDRSEPELDRQTDFNAPSRYDGDDSYDMYEEPDDEADRIIDVGDDEDYETYDFDDEFETMLGGSSDMPDSFGAGSMYEMNELRRRAGLAEVAEEEELEEIAPVIAAVARGAGAALASAGADALSGSDVEEDAAVEGTIAYDISDEKVYYVMADVLGNELDFGPEDQILVPAARNDQVLDALGQQGFEKGRDYCVDGEQYEADLQNGYNDRAFTDGQDYFPKGATSQPATDLGPTAGDQGDNPMSNKMRSIEKDDVYEGMKLAYRRYRKS